MGPRKFSALNLLPYNNIIALKKILSASSVSSKYKSTKSNPLA